MRRLRPFAATLATLTGVVSPPAAAGGSEWRWPVRGEVVERFAVSADPYVPGQHRGIDIAAKHGTAVRAACAGRVRFAGPAGAFGRAVTVACGGMTVSYGHLGSIAAHSGRSVAVGELLGTVGTTGRPSSHAPHLHFGIRRAGRRHGYVDPLVLLPGRAPSPGPPPLAPIPTRPDPPASSGPAPVPPSPAPAPARVPAFSSPAVPRSPGLWTWAGVALLALAIPGLALFGAARTRLARRHPAHDAHPPLAKMVMGDGEAVLKETEERLQQPVGA